MTNVKLTHKVCNIFDYLCPTMCINLAEVLFSSIIRFLNGPYSPYYCVLHGPENVNFYIILRALHLAECFFATMHVD